MRKNLYVAPSTDPIDVTKVEASENLIKYAKEISKAGADFLHCDIMDGKFVEKATYADNLVLEINKNCLIPLDVHLMVQNPQNYIEQYYNAGANILTVHYEAFSRDKDIIKCLKDIRSKKMLAGISLEPETPVEKILGVIKYCDLVLIMSVHPGKSGQKFIEQTGNKLIVLDKTRRDLKLNFLIEFDGGITPEIAQKIKKFGGDMVVSGNYIYKSTDKKQAIELLK